MSPTVSVIIVNYRSRLHTDKLITALLKGRFTDFEVIVVDNDVKNIGYGPAVNLGSRFALGQYLYITNPDTVPFQNTISRLVRFLDTHPSVGLAAPLLLDSGLKPYPLQGTADLNPVTAVFSLSAINKYWPANPVSAYYWLAGWSKTTPRQVAVAPGTAFMIRRQAWEEVGGFDPGFFLYFEESDLCRRLNQAGWQCFILPSSRLIHYWGASTPKTPATARIFAASRRYYFTKHFGPFSSWLVELVVQ